MAPPSTFLRPTDDEKRAILREQELKAQRKAHRKKEEAKERKAKLEADNRGKAQREKAARVEASLPSWDIHPTGRVLVTNYMLSPNAFWGRVDRGQTTAFKYVVSGAFTYDPIRQLWGVKTLAALDVALRMGTFHPIMVEPGDVEYLHEAVRVLLARERAKETPPAPPSPSPPPEPPVAPPPPPPSPETTSNSSSKGWWVDATDQERAACAKLGILPSTVKASVSWSEMGPISGLSSEQRMLRWIDIVKWTHRQASTEFFFDEEHLATELEEVVALEVDRLNHLATLSPRRDP